MMLPMINVEDLHRRRCQNMISSLRQSRVRVVRNESSTVGVRSAEVYTL